MQPAPDSLEFKRIFESAPALLLAIARYANFINRGASDADQSAPFSPGAVIAERRLCDIFPVDQREVGTTTGTINPCIFLERFLAGRILQESHGEIEPEESLRG